MLKLSSKGNSGNSDAKCASKRPGDRPSCSKLKSASEYSPLSGPSSCDDGCGLADAECSRCDAEKQLPNMLPNRLASHASSGTLTAEKLSCCSWSEAGVTVQVILWGRDGDYVGQPAGSGCVAGRDGRSLELRKV